MTGKRPNRLLAPAVIAGVTIGFLATAYKFVFAKPKKVQPQPVTSKPASIEPNQLDAAP